MGLNAFYSKPVDDPQNVLKRSLELGCTFWDTADIYMDNEIELSKILKDKKKKKSFLQRNLQILQLDLMVNLNMFFLLLKKVYQDYNYQVLNFIICIEWIQQLQLKIL